MRLLMQLPWRFLLALAVTAFALLLAYDLSDDARVLADRVFVQPIEEAFRLMR